MLVKETLSIATMTGTVAATKMTKKSNIQKLGQGDDYITGCSLDYHYLKKYYLDDSNRFK